MKQEKLLLDIQTKCSNIANEILNEAIDTKRTFTCKWPNGRIMAGAFSRIFCQTVGLLSKEQITVI